MTLRMATKRRRYSPEFKAAAVRQVRLEGKTRNAVAAALGVHPSLVAQWVATAPVPPDLTPAAKRAEALRLLRDEGLPLVQIAGRLHVSGETVKRWLKPYVTTDFHTVRQLQRECQALALKVAELQAENDLLRREVRLMKRVDRGSA